jgi:Family of unknown function (DUF6090)
MIKFFRTIRRNLIAEGKTSKYLKYAIGEIILVVVGILIALQINNWNEHQKILRAEEEILINLKSELSINRDQLGNILQIHENEFKDGLELLTLFNKDISNVPVSKLDLLVGSTETFYTFEANDGYIKSLIASGKIDYIQNNELKAFITAFEGLVIDAIQEGQILQSLLNERFWPTIDGKLNSSNRVRLFENYTDFPKGSYESDYTWFFNNREVEDILTNILGWKKAMILDEKILKETIDQNIILITKELNN